MQNGMIERNAGVPEERRIDFRMGVHLGDVVEESDGDLMGDGVNIVGRLEGIAKPGAICLSEDAYRQVKARLDLAVNDRPDESSEIAGPMRVITSLCTGPADAGCDGSNPESHMPTLGLRCPTSRRSPCCRSRT